MGQKILVVEYTGQIKYYIYLHNNLCATNIFLHVLIVDS